MTITIKHPTQGEVQVPLPDKATLVLDKKGVEIAFGPDCIPIDLFVLLLSITAGYKVDWDGGLGSIFLQWDITVASVTNTDTDI